MDSPQAVIRKTCFKINQLNKAIVCLDEMHRMFGEDEHARITRCAWEDRVAELQTVVREQENKIA